MFDKPYDPKKVEPEIYEKWEKSGFFAPEAHQPRADNPNANKTFTIAIPPPNVTGTLHMGHALNAAIQDILIRKKRMGGYKTLWIPGTDHAGIATQNVVEKELKKEGLTRFDLGREEFLKRIWAWKEKYGNIILDQLKKLGSSCDWSRTRFTMDAEYEKAVVKAFEYYRTKGWIDRDKRVINWCPHCRTSLSDLELEYYKEEKGKLWYIKYPLEKEKNKFIVVATTRPETMLGDEAVAVNPKDTRHKNLLGKKAILPIKDKPIRIISDRRVDMSFGTGAVKVTPAHDLLDAAIAEDHQLYTPQVIDEGGRMTQEAGEEFEGLKVLEAREKVIAKLTQLGLIDKVEDYTHNVAKCYRCGTTIEPLRSMQWFLKMDELAKLAIKDVKSGKVKFHPKRWEKIYFDWLKNIKDWCISRQIWWGHKIPGSDGDVFDTWFSSALWPFATLGWPEKTRDLEIYYPTQVLSTARDIINLWVARMIFSSEEFLGKAPFPDVVIHATILAKSGQRMSKSLGTGVDPMDLVEKYGADATRFGLIWQAMGGQDIHWAEEHVLAGKKFLNKIWNASRFVLQRTEENKINLAHLPSPQKDSNKKILKELKKISKKVDKNIEAYEFGPALHELYDFFWHTFCDKYLEETKKNDTDETKETLLFVLANSLKLLHPFVPFVTEKIWEELPAPTGGENKNLLMIESWPEL